MKYNVKKKNSTLEVTVELQEHRLEDKENNRSPKIMVDTNSIAAYLIRDGHSPGIVLDDNGSSTISNARWQDVFGLKTVWIYEDKSSSKNTTVLNPAPKTQNSNKQKKQK